MPPWVTDAPRRIPLQGLVLKLALGEPQDKISLVTFIVIGLHALPDAHRQIILIVVVEDIVMIQLRGIKVDIASGKIGVACVHELADDLNILLDHAGGGLHYVGIFDIQLLAVCKKGVRVELGDLHHCLVFPLSSFQHLVLTSVRIGGQVSHICDIHNPGDLVAVPPKELLQHILHQIAAQVPDVGEMVNGRSAGIHAHLTWDMGDKILLRVSGRIIQLHHVRSL